LMFSKFTIIKRHFNSANVAELGRTRRCRAIGCHDSTT
jgi:hypothetical protein